MKKKLFVLIIEDSEEDAMMNVSHLEKEGYDVYYERVETADEMKLALAKPQWDLILSDYSMPEFDVLSALSICHESEVDIPFIVISGAIGEEKAIELVKSGAHDYFLKNNMSRFVSAVKRELSEAENRQELIWAHSAIKSIEQNYQNYIRNAPDGVCLEDETGKFIEVNIAFCEMTGYSMEELLQMSISDIISEESVSEGLAHFRKLVKTGKAVSDLLIKQKRGSKRWLTANTVKFKKRRFLSFTKDITKRKQMEESFRVQKIELEIQNNELRLASGKAEAAIDKYTELYDFAPSGYYTLAKDAKIIALNLSGATLLGKERVNLINRRFDIFVTKDTRAVLKDFLRKAFDSRVKEVCELKLLTHTNTLLFVHLTGIATENRKQCLVNVIDITERKQAEADLHLVNRFLDSIVENIPNMIFVKDANTLRFIRVNRAGEELLGYAREDLIGKNDYHFFSKEFADTFVEKDREVLRSKELVDIPEEPMQTKYEGPRVLHTKKVPILNKRGEPEYLLGISEDITRQKRDETALKESEELFRSVVHNSSDLTTLTDSHGIITFCSPQCESVIGYPGERFLGQMMPDIIHPHDLIKTQEAWEKLINQGQNMREFEYRIIDREGNIRWLSHSANLIRIDDKILSIQNTIRNITERKQVEQALKVSEEKYRTMLNASPDGIFIIDLKGNITDVSEIGLELLGAETKEDIVGKKFQLFIPSDEKNTIREIGEKTINEGLAQNIGLKIKKKNQTLFPAETSVTLIQSPDGAPLSYMIIVRDISQRKKMETKQMHADRMANLGEMASGIAHEINQPLNIISMVMDKLLFEADKTDTIKIEFLTTKSNKIFENITRIRNIIDHIRAFSRSQDDYILTPFDINTSIINATSMITEQFKHLGIKLNLQLEKTISPILGNTYKFEQVMINLLTNAKDALVEKKNKNEEGFNMIIGIRSFQEQQFTIVEVTDNGIGITNDDINNIILPFYTTKEEGKGTGLGLSICYQIMTEMNGTIDIKSENLNGTKISLVLDTQKQKEK